MDELKIFKIISNEDNCGIVNRANGIFNSQNQIPNDLLNLLSNCSNIPARDKYCFIKDNTNILNCPELIYFGIYKNRIVCRFTHNYIFSTKQIYLDFAETHPMEKNKGFGTSFYNLVIKDIIKNFRPTSFCANAISPSGKRFLEKVGFLPNTKPISYDCNSIYYLHNEKPYLINLSDLPPSRGIKDSPNKSVYNTLLKEAKINGSFNEKNAKDNFYAIIFANNKDINPTIKSALSIKPVNFDNLELPEHFYLKSASDRIKNQLNILKNLDNSAPKK